MRLLSILLRVPGHHVPVRILGVGVGGGGDVACVMACVSDGVDGACVYECACAFVWKDKYFIW